MGCRFKKWIVVLSLFALLTLGTASASTEPKVEWEQKFGGSGWDAAYAVQQTGDGGYIIAGTYDWGSGYDVDVWIIKLDSYGSKEWDKKFGGIGGDEAHAIQQTSDGGYIVAGIYDSGHYENGGWVLEEHAWVIKLDANGNKEWDKIFSDPDSAYAIQQTSDGGYIVVGSYNLYGWVAKLDANGNLEWEKKFGGGIYGDDLYSVQQTDDGGYIVVGCYVLDNGDSQAWVIKLDANGNKEWEKLFGSVNFNPDSANAVQQTNDGGYIIAGCTQGMTPSIWVIKLDANGNKEWDRVIGFGMEATAYAIQQTSDGGYIVTGYSIDLNGNRHVLIMKLDTNGNLDWYKELGDTGWNVAYAVQQTSDEGYIIAGTYDWGNGDIDAWVIKLEGENPQAKITTIRIGSMSIDNPKIYQDEVVYTTEYGEWIPIVIEAINDGNSKATWQTITVSFPDFEGYTADEFKEYLSDYPSSAKILGYLDLNYGDYSDYIVELNYPLIEVVENDIYPGDKITLSFKFKPPNPGTYRLYIKSIVGGNDYNAIPVKSDPPAGEVGSIDQQFEYVYCLKIKVQELQPPVAKFTYSPELPKVGDEVTFDASSSYDPDGYIVSYEWDFGDGFSETDSDPIITHTYYEAGTYTATLTVTDNDGLTSTISKTIIVEERTYTPDSYEPDDTMSQASLIYPDEPQHHNFHKEGDVDWVRFYATAGYSYIIETYNLGENCDTVIYLYDDSGNLIASDDNSGEGHASKIEWTCQWSGYYYIKIVNYHFDVYGEGTDYWIKIEKLPPSLLSLMTSPRSLTMSLDSTSTIDIVLDNAPTGLSYANVTVSLNPSIAEITDISFPSWVSLTKNSSLPSSTVWFKVGDLNNQVKAGDTNVVLATLTIKGLSEGTSEISITVNSLQDDNYAEIKDQIATIPGTITVIAGPPPINDHQPKDLNRDGKFEDVNGDNNFNFGDIVFFFQNFDKPEIKNYPNYYDFNGDGNVNFGDVVALFQML